jgi:hypothetical protein
MGETESAEQRNESTNAALQTALNFVRLEEQLMRVLAFSPGALQVYMLFTQCSPTV